MYDATTGECVICGVATLRQFYCNEGWLCGDCYEEESMRCGPGEDGDDD